MIVMRRRVLTALRAAVSPHASCYVMSSNTDGSSKNMPSINSSNVRSIVVLNSGSIGEY